MYGIILDIYIRCPCYKSFSIPAYTYFTRFLGSQFHKKFIGSQFSKIYCVSEMYELYQYQYVLKQRETILKNSKVVFISVTVKFGKAGNFWTHPRRAEVKG